MNLTDITKKADTFYRGNEFGHNIFLHFCLGVMQSRMNAEDLKIMDDYLDARRRGMEKACYFAESQ